MSLFKVIPRFPDLNITSFLTNNYEMINTPLSQDDANNQDPPDAFAHPIKKILSEIQISFDYKL